MGDTYESHRRRPQQRFSAARTTLFVVVLTVAAVGILVLAIGQLSHDRASVAAFRAAPTCPANVSAAAAVTDNCQLVAAYTVASTSQQGSGSDWAAFITLQPTSGAQLQLQFAAPANQIGFADDGDTVHLTTWHGVPILVANSILTAELVNPLLESGNGPYNWLWYTTAAYVFLVPLAIVQHRSRLLVIAPAVALIAGLYLHGRVVGGDWVKSYLWVGLIPLAFYFVYVSWREGFFGRLRRR